ncbi:MAG: hypothetical protein AABX83_01365 [Nanoarchaeota archaeon]
MERDKKKENQYKLMKNNKNIYFIYSIIFALFIVFWMTFGIEFKLIPVAIGALIGLLLGLIIAYVVRMVVNKKEEVKKYFGINVTLNEVEILICIISLFSFDIIFESIGNPYLFDFLGMVLGILVGWMIVKLVRKIKNANPNNPKTK